MQHSRLDLLRIQTFLVAILLAGLSFGASAAAPNAQLLKNIPVTGTVVEGGTFEGTLSIADLSLNEAGQLVASGVLRGRVDGGRMIRDTFEGVELGLSEGAVAQQAPNECQILFLDLGPIFLDLLGLTVDLSQITLDITAVAGPGNLLGNLLCAVAGLLDNFGPSLGAVLESILNSILNAINQLL